MREPRVVPPPIVETDEHTQPAIATKPSEDMPGFLTTEHHPARVLGYKYLPCTPNRALPNVLYSKSELPNERPGLNLLDRSAKIAFNDAGVVTSADEYASCRANVSLAAGDWYYEINIVNADGPAHVRLGLSRREFSVDGAVGSCAYSYGLSDTGKSLHVARPKPFSNGFKTGDTIGFHIGLPRTRAHTVPQGPRRNRMLIRFCGQLYFETLDYVPSKDLFDLEIPRAGLSVEPIEDEYVTGSFIKIYKNGHYEGELATNLREFLPNHSTFDDTQYAGKPYNDGMLGYMPTISCSGGGQAQFELENFRFPVPDGARPAGELFVEHIADDIVMDIVDQVHFELNDPFLGPTEKIQGIIPSWDSSELLQEEEPEEQQEEFNLDEMRRQMAAARTLVDGHEEHLNYHEPVKEEVKHETW